jgi:hypothetical protein
MKIYHALVVEGPNGEIVLNRAAPTAEKALSIVNSWMQDHMEVFGGDVPDWDLLTIYDPHDELYYWSASIFELDTDDPGGCCRYLSADDIRKQEHDE